MELYPTLIRLIYKSYPFDRKLCLKLNRKLEPEMRTYLDGENAQWSSVKAYKNDTLTKLIIVNDLIYTLNSKSIIVSYAIKPATGKCKITSAKTRIFDFRKKIF